MVTKFFLFMGWRFFNNKYPAPNSPSIITIRIPIIVIPRSDFDYSAMKKFHCGLNLDR